MPSSFFIGSIYDHEKDYFFKEAIHTMASFKFIDSFLASTLFLERT